MKKILVGSLSLLLASPMALAADHIIKWGINSELDYFLKSSGDFKKRVESRSGGKIEVQISEIKAPQEGYDHLKDVKNGTFQMSQELVFELQKHVPELAIWDLPYLFKNDTHVEKYMNSQPAKNLMGKLKEQDVVGLGYTYSGGFILFYGAKVNSFQDMAKSEIGVESSSDSYKNFFNQSLKSATFQTNHDNYLAAKSKVKVSEIIGAVGEELYSFAKAKSTHVNVTNHRVISRVLFISRSFLESLPADLRKIVIEEGERVSKIERDLSIVDRDQFLKEANKKNLHLNVWSAEQMNAGREHFQPLYQDFIKRHGKDAIKHVQSLE